MLIASRGFYPLAPPGGPWWPPSTHPLYIGRFAHILDLMKPPPPLLLQCSSEYRRYWSIKGPLSTETNRPQIKSRCGPGHHCTVCVVKWIINTQKINYLKNINLHKYKESHFGVWCEGSALKMKE